MKAKKLMWRQFRTQGITKNNYKSAEDRLTEFVNRNNIEIISISNSSDQGCSEITLYYKEEVKEK